MVRSPAPYPRELIAEKARLSAEDLALARSARREHNKLGLAYQIAFVRLTGRAPGQKPFEVLEELVGFVAAELGGNPRDLDRYAERQPTLSVHLRRVREHLGLGSFDEDTKQALERFVFDEAFRLEETSALISRSEEFLQTRSVLLPGRWITQRVVQEQRDRARRTIFSRILDLVPDESRPLLDGLLDIEGSGQASRLQILKMPPGLPSPRSFLKLVEKLELIRETEILRIDLGWLNNNLRRALARRARSADAHRLRELVPPHRYTVIVCFLHDTYVETVDQAVEMHTKIMNQAYRRAKNQLDEQLVARRRQVRDALKSFRGITRAILEARKALDEVDAEELLDRIFRSVSEEKLEAQLAETDKWFDAEPSETFSLVAKRFQYLRRFSPSLLEHVPLRAEPGPTEELLEAVEVLRTMNQTAARKLPKDVPTRFLSPGIRSAVETESGIDRHAYECAVLTAIRDEVRRGNLWVEGSRRFRQLEDFFLEEDEWALRRSDFFRRSSLPEDPAALSDLLRTRLGAAFDRFLESLPENAHVNVTDEGWSLSSDPSDKRSPEEEEALEHLTAWLGNRLRTIRLPDLLIEVDNELDWTRHFMPPSRRRERSVQDICEVVATVMAYGCNIGPETMSRLTNGVSYKAIRRIADWRLSSDTLRAALADLVDAITRSETSATWGEARTSSSDGQRFLFPRKSLKATYSHRLGEYGLEFYTFVADNYAPFYSTPIECTERDAAYVLDGLLYHESEIDPEEHYTDTHGYTELNFAAFAMFGKRFCPRIRGLHRQWIYRIDRERDYGPLAPILGRKGRTIHLDWIEAEWERIGRFFASFESGQTTASVALKRLMRYGPKNRFYRAVRELGRVFKTEFILDYLSQPALRKRIRRGLLKGEQLHALARTVHYGRRGRLDQQDFRRQTGAASCLLLTLAAIIYWQIQEIDRVLDEPGEAKDELDLRMLSHISPISWDNILLYGEYQLNRDLVRS